MLHLCKLPWHIIHTSRFVFRSLGNPELFFGTDHFPFIRFFLRCWNNARSLMSQSPTLTKWMWACTMSLCVLDAEVFLYFSSCQPSWCCQTSWTLSWFHMEMHRYIYTAQCPLLLRQFYSSYKQRITAIYTLWIESIAICI